MTAHVAGVSRTAQTVVSIEARVYAEGLTTRDEVIREAMLAARETRASLHGWDTNPPKDSFCDEHVTVTMYRD